MEFKELTDEEWSCFVPQLPPPARTERLTRFNRDNYSVGRSCVERFFGWLKGGFRRLVVRYERLTSNFLGFLHLACIAILLRGMKWVSTSDLGRSSQR